MRSICYICGILFDVKKPPENDAETHGICDECWPAVQSNLNKAEKEIEAILPISSETKHKTLIPAGRGTGGQSVRKS